MANDYELPDWVQPGASFSLFFQKGNVNNARYHVRGLVDDMIVVRRWFKSRSWWHYEVLSPVWFEVNDKYLIRRRQA